MRDYLLEKWPSIPPLELQAHWNCSGTMLWPNTLIANFDGFFFSIYYQSRWPETLKNTFELWECIQSFLPIVITATGNCPQQIHCLFLFE